MTFSMLSGPPDEPSASPTSEALRRRIETLDWEGLELGLSSDGYAVTPTLLSPEECKRAVALYAQEDQFRSRIVMERYAFGRGEYKYFSYPLPDLVQTMRTALYPHLAPIANRWHAAMRMESRFPADHTEYSKICNAAGQRRPTPLMLRYGPKDYCCLHQDLYGQHVFPFQAVILLSSPQKDFKGGELLLTETDPKRAGRAEVVPLSQGQAVVFAVNSRPVKSSRGFYRVNLRHGVSRLDSGHRYTMGIIFHDAK